MELHQFTGMIEGLTFYHIIPRTEDIIKLFETTKPIFPKDSKSPISVSTLPPRNLNELKHWKAEHAATISTLKFRETSLRKEKVLLCHDMKGGYLDYEIQDQISISDPSIDLDVYNFKMWKCVDIFVYFSHHRVSIPPVGWINVSHRNGVKVLGTFITEWDEGAKECEELLQSEQSIQFYTKQLVDICFHFGFDGWFINIENKIPNENIPKLLHFMNVLRDALRKMDGKVLWYDSVTINGDLKWQNELNKQNKIFFENSDGIFLNYNWNEEKISESSKLADQRKHEIFTGIDVFGRGGFQSHVALEEIVKSKTSAAFFAPGWTHETKEGGHVVYELRDEQLWLGRKSQLLYIDKNNSPNIGDWEITENGGQGWSIREENSKKSYVTSHRWCKKSKIIKLTDANLLNTFPEIIITEDYKGVGPNFADLYYLRVELQDADRIPISIYFSGIITCSDHWQTIVHSFRNYKTVPHYIYWEHGGKDSENWVGHYGAQIRDSTLIIKRNADQASNGVAQYFPEKRIPSKIPFVTNFSDGRGFKFFVKGEEVMSKNFVNMSNQSVLPTNLVSFLQSGNKLVTTYYNNQSVIEPRLQHDLAYDGGNCLLVKTSSNLPNHTLLCPLFHCEFSLKNSLLFQIKYQSTGDLGVLLFIGNDYVQLGNKFEPKYQSISPTSKAIEKDWIVSNFEIDASESILSEIHFIFKTDISGDFTAKIGELSLISKIVESPEEITLDYDISFHLDSIYDTNTRIGDVSLKWNTSAELQHTDVYLDGKWIGRSFTHGFLAKSVQFSNVPRRFTVKCTFESNVQFQKEIEILGK